MTITSAVPGGIIIEPISGLALNDFTGGVEFFKSLPSVTNPSDLRLIPSASGSDLDAGAWLDSVKLQVVTQYKKIKTGAIEAGFTAAFTSPMIISGGAKVFDAYATKESFNGDVEFQISTDGKFLLRGTLNFASDLLSLKATIYADLSHIASGSVTVLFLADIPEQFRFLVIAGKFQMGFKVPTAPVEFTTVTPSETPYANLISPADGGSLSLNALNTQLYIDVEFLPSNGQSCYDFDQWR